MASPLDSQCARLDCSEQADEALEHQTILGEAREVRVAGSRVSAVNMLTRSVGDSHLERQDGRQRPREEQAEEERPHHALHLRSGSARGQQLTATTRTAAYASSSV